MSRWTHSICLGCWSAQHPGREPVRVTDGQPRTCCFCGVETLTGIFVRHDPSLLKHCNHIGAS